MFVKNCINLQFKPWVSMLFTFPLGILVMIASQIMDVNSTEFFVLFSILSILSGGLIFGPAFSMLLNSISLREKRMKKLILQSIESKENISYKFCPPSSKSKTLENILLNTFFNMEDVPNSFIDFIAVFDKLDREGIIKYDSENNSWSINKVEIGEKK